MCSLKRGRTEGRRSCPQSKHARLHETNRQTEGVGEECGKKIEGSIRIMSNNINGISINNYLKLDKVKSIIDDFDVDVFGCQEVNVCWSRCKYSERLFSKLRGWKESCISSVAYNATESSTKKKQFGGVAMITVGSMAYRKMETGFDHTRRGRWQWTRYRGAYDRVVRVVNVYRPCHNLDVGSTYSQQARSMLKNKDAREPRAAWMEDLAVEIKSWRKQGDSLIIMGDFNEDVRSKSFQDWKEDLHLIDSCLNSLDDTQQAPATFNRGSAPIDTILCTSGVEILKAGYLPFGEGVGDHRPLYVDVKLASILGVKLPPVKKAKARRLKLQDPRVVKKYNHELEKYLRMYKVKERSTLLQNYVTNGGDIKVVELEYEELDRIRIKGMQVAESKCRKLKKGGIAWTPGLSRARHKITVWMLVIRRLKGCAVSAKTIIRMKKKAGMEEINTTIDLSNAKTHMDKAFREYKEYIKDAAAKRIEFQCELASAKAKHGNTTASKALQNMIRVEEQRAAARRIRWMNGKERTSHGLNRAVAPNALGQWVEVNTKETLEEALKEENSRRFTQANDTPLMRGKLYDELSILPSHEITSALLDGSYLAPNDTAPGVQEVLNHLKLKESATAIWRPQPLTIGECTIGWKNTKETVSSAAKHGTHMGHWKAGYKTPYIAAVHTAMANVPYLSGYSPTRWQYGVNVMLEKEEGNARVDRLRTILLYESDFNFNNSMMGRNMMKSAEQSDTIAREQYGSRQGMNAIQCALNKRLLFDIARHTKRPLGVCSCDLKSCYDRIIHNFAAVAMQRAGAPRTAITSMLTTISKLKHAVRTVYGDSEQTFGGEDWRHLEPLHGIGQGNGAGPAIWAVVSSVLFDYIRDRGYGAKLCSPLSKLALHFAGLGFVDDTDIVQLGFADEDYWEVAAKLQEALQLWETGAVTSGGLLVPKKSWYCLVDFVWHDGDWSYNKDMDDAQVHVKDGEGIPHNLVLLSATEAKRMLGVYLSADGTNTTQKKILRQVAEQWREKVRVGTLTKQDAWLALTSIVMKTLEYPLLATTLTQAECTHIMAPILEGGLTKAGICRNMARALVHGPKLYKGLDLHNLYTTQGLVQIQAILNHCWQGTDTGVLLKTSMEYIKLEIGMPSSLFQLDYQLYGHLAEDSLVKHVWEFMSQKGIEVQDEVGGFEMLREKDVPISVYFSNAFKHGIITAQEWKRANLCRKYLRVLTVADIATGDGKSITSQALNGIRSSATRKLPWFEQGNPNASDWKIWRSVLTRSACFNDGKLWIELGKWKHEAVQTVRENWEWFWDECNEILYQRRGTIWRRYQRHTRPRRLRSSPAFQHYTIMQQPPQWQLLHMTTVRHQLRYTYIEGFALSTIKVDNPLPYQKTIEGLQQWMKDQNGEEWVFGNVAMTENIDKIVQAIANGSAIGVSDGSFKDEFGTAAWVLEDITAQQRIVGTLITPGFHSDHSAYRSEISGIYAMVTMVESIKHVWGLTKGTITLGCDGDQAGLQALDIHSRTTVCTQQSFDLLSGIQGKLKSSTITYTYRHVKGHQNDDKKLEDLDYWALLNIEMDILAKDWWALKHTTEQYFQYKVPKGIWKISLLGNRVSNDLNGYLREGIEGAVTAQYWVEKRKRYTEDSFFLVDWTAIKKALKSTSLQRQHWVTKFDSGCCPTNKMMHIWKQRLIPNCPRCNASVEDTEHVLQCPSKSSITTWEKSMEKMKLWLLESNTCPDLIIILLTALNQWKFGKPLVRPTALQFPRTNELWDVQLRIGWRNAFGGSLATLWKEIQHNYYVSLGRRKTGARWVTELIQKLWQVSWDQWADRNMILHGTPLADDMEGALSLDRSITFEWSKGTTNMPNRVKKTFPYSVDSILNKSLESKKQWFTLVRSYREMVGDIVDDEFSIPHKKMRKWVGLALEG